MASQSTAKILWGARKELAPLFKKAKQKELNEEELQSLIHNKPEKTHFPFFMLFFAIVKDALDAILTAAAIPSGGVTEVVLIIVSAICAVILFIWFLYRIGFKQGATRQQAKGLAKKLTFQVRRQGKGFGWKVGGTIVGENVPVLNVIPFNTILVLWTYFSEKKIVRLFLQSKQILEKRGLQIESRIRGATSDINRSGGIQTDVDGISPPPIPDDMLERGQGGARAMPPQRPPLLPQSYTDRSLKPPPLPQSYLDRAHKPPPIPNRHQTRERAAEGAVPPQMPPPLPHEKPPKLQAGMPHRRQKEEPQEQGDEDEESDTDWSAILDELEDEYLETENEEVFQEMLNDKALEHLLREMPEGFSDEFSGEVSEDGFLIDLDGNETEVRAIDCIHPDDLDEIKVRTLHDFLELRDKK